jgi:hypothetical protein
MTVTMSSETNSAGHSLQATCPAGCARGNQLRLLHAPPLAHVARLLQTQVSLQLGTRSIETCAPRMLAHLLHDASHRLHLLQS